MLRNHLPCHPTPACVAHAIWRWAALHNRASGPGRSEGCGIVGRATGASFTATDGPAAQRDAKDPRGSPTGGETLGHQGRHRVLPPDEFDAGRRTCICAVHALYVHCGCTVHSRHLNSVQAPPREANEALVYATKQAQLGPGLGHVTCSALQCMQCITRCTLHRRWGRTTASRGTLTTAPSTRYAGDQPPQCMYIASLRMRTERQATSESQPWP